MIWGNISRPVNGENVLGGVAYKNINRLIIASETDFMCMSKRANLTSNNYLASVPHLTHLGERSALIFLKLVYVYSLGKVVVVDNETLARACNDKKIN